jgi:hypothetical protein
VPGTLSPELEQRLQRRARRRLIVGPLVVALGALVLAWAFSISPSPYYYAIFGGISMFLATLIANRGALRFYRRYPELLIGLKSSRERKRNGSSRRR